MYQYIRNTSHKPRVLVHVAYGLLALSLAGLWAWHSQGLQLLSIQTASMAPLLQPGDAVLVLRTDPNSLQPGAVISFRVADGTVVTHRLIGFDHGRFLTQGDSNHSVDAPVEPSALVGRTRLSFNNLGYVINFLRSPAGLLLSIYLPALAVVAIEFRHLLRYYQPPYRHVSYLRRLQY